MNKQITLKFPMEYDNSKGHQKIPAIKALRTLAGLGLKEAKDLSEMWQSNQTITVGVGSFFYGMSDEQVLQHVARELQVLKQNGVEVVSVINGILNQLRQLAIEAMEANEDEMANEILQLVLAEKLRRPQHDFE